MNIEEEIRNIKQVLRILILSDASYQAITTGKVISYAQQKELLHMLEDIPKETKKKDKEFDIRRCSIYCPVCESSKALDIQEHNDKIYIKCFKCKYEFSLKGRRIE